jgi:serine phosphatase RsbU (regulator of sigma subunit)
LEKGDKIYLFSDGYADQFGGVKGKKFMYRRFRELILGVSSKEFSTQKNELELEFKNWRKDIEQLDDVCVVGIEV